MKKRKDSFQQEGQIAHSIGKMGKKMYIASQQWIVIQKIVENLVQFDIHFIFLCPIFALMKAGKVLHIILAVLVALFISGHLLLNNRKIQEDAASHVVKIAQAALGTDVSAGRVQLTYPFGLSIDDLTIYDLSHDTLAHIASLSIRLKPLQLLKNKLSITSIRVNSPSVRLYADSPESEPNYAFLTAGSGNGKPMSFRANSILIRNGSVKYDILSAAQTDSLFNPDHIGVSSLTANVSLKSLSSDSVSFIIRKFAFTEQSGFRLSKAKGTVTVSDDFTRLTGLSISTPGSRLEASTLTAAIGLGERPKGLPKIETDLKATVTGNDFKAFLPQMAHMTDPLDISLNANSAHSESIVLNSLSVRTPDHILDMDMSGTILMDSNLNLKGFRNAKVQGSFRDGMPAWIGSQFGAFGLTVPSQIAQLGDGDFRASLDSRGKDIRSDIQLNSQLGAATCRLEGKGGKYNGEIKADDIKLSHITGNDKLGNCSFTANAQATQKKDGYYGSFQSNIGSLVYNLYNYKDIKLQGSFDPDLILSDLVFSDRNGSLALNAGIGTGSAPYYKVNLDADSLNLNAYHLTERENMTLSASVAADLGGRNIDDIEGKISIDSVSYADNDGDWSMDNMTVEIGRFNDFVRIITLQSDFMNMSVTGDYTLSTLPGSIAKACGDALPTIGKMLATKLGAADYTGNTHNDFAVEANIDNTDLLVKVMHYPVSLTKPAQIQLNFSDQENTCSGNIFVPEALISDKLLSDGIISINSAEGTCYTDISGFYGDRSDDGIGFKASLMAFMDIVRGKYSWDSMTGLMSGTAKTLSQFFRYDSQNGLKSLTFIDTTSVVVNGTPWDLSISRISTDKRKITVSDFFARNDNQLLHADGTISADSIDIFKLSMTRINLGRTLSILNKNGKIALEGIASGTLSIAGLLGKPAFYGSLSIDDFQFMDSYHGLLTADCRWNQITRQVELDGTMVNEGIETTAFTGYYIPQDKYIDVSMDADHTDLHFLNTWTKSVFSELDGRATGKLRLFGSIPKLDLEGQAILDDAYFVQDAINTTFKVKHDTLWFEPGKMLFRDVEFYDENGHDGLMTCILTHNKFSKWRVDMTADVADMLVYYQPKNERSDIFASVYAEGSMKLKFDERNGLAISVDARTAPGTKIGYSPSSGTVADYSFLTIVDRNTIKLDEETVRHIIPEKTRKGRNFSLDFEIECSEDALIEMDMASLNGFFRGNGDISLKYTPKNGPVLNGIYNLKYGQCALSVEDVIRKNFTLMEGSYVRFNGAPMDTELFLQTYHNVNSASIYDLDPSVSSNNKVHVRCLMDITGNVSDPRISFDIDIPNGTPEEKAVLASATATEEQRNIQFMYLLAIGRFYTYDVVAMNDGQTPSAMESIVNSTVSGQINNVLSQVLDNEKVSISSNVSASSYLSNDATNLSNKELEGILEAHLLNNRLMLNGNFGYRENTINNTSNFIGDFEFKYLLFPDKNGKGISLKGYNKANDKYFSKTTLTTQGVGLVFEKDF